MKKNYLKSVFLSLTMLFILSCSYDKTEVSYSLSKPESITAIRKVKLVDDLKFGETAILGVVISDHSHGNFETGILAVQQQGQPAGILLELNNANEYEVGDEIKINLEGAELHYVDEELRVGNLSEESVVKTGNKVTITPRTTDIPTMLGETKYWGPILVEVEALTFVDGNTIYGGENTIDDGIVSTKLLVLSTADFYEEKAAKKFDKIVGITRLKNAALKLYPRSMADITLTVNEIKETFEDAASTSYDEKTLSFKTGSWGLSGGITATSSADLKNGLQSVRLQGTTTNSLRSGILDMKFDVQGVKKIKVSHGIYPAAAELANVNPTTLELQISKNQGQTYVKVATLTINTQSTVLITDEIPLTLNETEMVRFRLVNTSIPFSSNNRPRINIDDFTIVY